MDAKVIRYLKKLPLFEGLPEDVLAELAGAVTEQELVKGDVLFRQADPGDAVYVVRTGWMKIVVNDSAGQELTINQVGPAEIIGEMSLLDDRPRAAGAVALSPVQVYRLDNEDFKAVIDRYPQLGMLFARNISERLRFNITYLQNAVEWSYQVARGDYSFVMEQLEEVQFTIVDSRKPDDARARQLLSAFFEMVKEVKQREDKLKLQLQKFNITLDEAKRQEDVEELTQKTGNFTYPLKMVYFRAT
jgi:CRP-like cAMP-binding protein